MGSRSGDVTLTKPIATPGHFAIPSKFPATAILEMGKRAVTSHASLNDLQAGDAVLIIGGLYKNQNATFVATAGTMSCCVSLLKSGRNVTIRAKNVVTTTYDHGGKPKKKTAEELIEDLSSTIDALSTQLSRLSVQFAMVSDELQQAKDRKK